MAREKQNGPSNVEIRTDLQYAGLCISTNGPCLMHLDRRRNSGSDVDSSVAVIQKEPQLSGRKILSA